MKRKPKIAVIGLKGLPAFGGAARVGQTLMSQLKSEYAFVVFSVNSHVNRANYHEPIDGINQIVFRSCGRGGFNTFQYYLKCLLYVLFHKYELIHLHHAESGFITPFLRLKYKVIVTFHGIFRNHDPKFSKPTNLLFKLSESLNLRFANEVISVSSIDTEYINNTYKKKVKNIPNGINLSQIICKKQAGADYMIFSAGRIYEIKGLHIILEALHKYKIKHKLFVAGDLEQVENYKNKIHSLSEGLNVEFAGLIKNKQNLLSLIANSKFFIFPSLTEAMSMMLLEAISTKTPVIASDIPANKILFTEDEVLFFESNNVDSLGEKIQYALNNPEAMEIKAQNAYEHLEKQYALKEISMQYHSLFQKLLFPCAASSA